MNLRATPDILLCLGAGMVLIAAPATARDHADPPLWTGAAAPDVATAEKIMVVGGEAANGFVPASVVVPAPDAPAPGPALAPIGVDILDRYMLRVFGVERRAAFVRQGAKQGGGFALRCAAGARPAGFVLAPRDLALPHGMEGALRLSGSAAGAGWGVSVVAPGADAPTPAQARFAAQGASVPLAGLPAQHQIVLVCPQGAAQATLSGLMIAPRASRTRPARPGTWIWSDRDWIDDPAGFARRAGDAGVGDVALQLRIADGAVVGGDRLGALFAALHARRITGYLVEGDPAMATPQGLPAALTRVKLLRAALEAAGVRDGGLELDIEPNALPGYGADPAAAWQGWAVAVRAIASAWGRPVTVDLPWWMRDAPGGRAALAAAAPSIAGVAVMDYRTDPQAIVAGAAPWLAWGIARELPVRIAVENGALQTEVDRHYVHAAQGELIVADGNARLFAAPRVPAAGETAFRFTHETRVAPQRISFCGNADRLRAVRDEVEPMLAAWPSFAGLKIHQLLDQTRCG